MEDYTSSDGRLKPPVELFQLIARTSVQGAADAIAVHEARFHHPAARKGRLTFTSTEGLAEYVLKIAQAILEDHRTEEHEPAVGSIHW